MCGTKPAKFGAILILLAVGGCSRTSRKVDLTEVRACHGCSATGPRRLTSLNDVEWAPVADAFRADTGLEADKERSFLTWARLPD